MTSLSTMKRRQPINSAKLMDQLKKAQKTAAESLKVLKTLEKQATAAEKRRGGGARAWAVTEVQKVLRKLLNMPLKNGKPDVMRAYKECKDKSDEYKEFPCIRTIRRKWEQLVKESGTAPDQLSRNTR